MDLYCGTRRECFDKAGSTQRLAENSANAGTDFTARPGLLQIIGIIQPDFTGWSRGCEYCSCGHL